MGDTRTSAAELALSSAGRRLCNAAFIVAFMLTSSMMMLMPACSLALPEGRVYEMVSPVFKGGYGAQGLVVAPGGERVVFSSPGAFAGDPANNPESNGYVARREAGVEWSTAPLMPPATLVLASSVGDFSPTLDLALAGGKPGANEHFAGKGTEQEFLLHPTDAPDTAPNAPEPGPNWQLAGITLKDLNETPPGATVAGSSSDFSHMVLENSGNGLEQWLPEAASTESRLYDNASSQPCGALSEAVCSEAPTGASLRLVGLNNEGKAIDRSCRPSLGAGGQGRFNAVSADGGEVFFRTSIVNPCANEGQLFVRLAGARTLEVSRPLDSSKPFGGCVGEGSGVPGEVPCAGAGARKPSEFWGASEDGSRVFFTTSEPLEPATDKDSANDLYMAKIGCPSAEPECGVPKREVTSLVQVSHDPNTGQLPEIQGVVAIAPDGSHVYYVARGELLEESEVKRLEGEGRLAPHAGADNLYVYDSLTATTTFVADLCSGPGLSGKVEDIACPLDLEPEGSGVLERNDVGLWASGTHEAQVNVCARPSAGECTGARETGRFLVFSSYARLTADDTDNARDVYRYDAVTGTLERVSLGEAGYHENGNGEDEVASGKLLQNADASIADSEALGDFRVFRQHDMNSRAVSEDGARVVFTTSEPLSEAVGNGLSNAYIWHEGSVSSISTGSASAPVNTVLISSSGRDVFFTTTQGLVPQDTDGQQDVYDARIGGGFPPPPPEPQLCKGDACQGPLTNPAPLLVPGSGPQAPGENLAPPAKVTPKKLTRAQQLARALKACAKRPKRRRAACRRSARVKYAKAGHAARGSRR
jgi:hypothetical protein